MNPYANRSDDPRLVSMTVGDLLDRLAGVDREAWVCVEGGPLNRVVEGTPSHSGKYVWLGYESWEAALQRTERGSP